MLALSTLLLAACGPKPADVVRQSRGAVEPKLASLEAIGELVKAATPLESDQFDVTGQSPAFGQPASQANAVVMAPEHFNGLETDNNDFHLVLDNPDADVASLVRAGTFANGEPPGSAAKTKQMLEQFAALRYSLVVRMAGYTPPRRDGATFEGGSCLGEARLYDIDQRRLLGGFRFQASSSTRVEVDQQHADSFLAANLRVNALRLISTEFARRFPGASPPFSRE